MSIARSETPASAYYGRDLATMFGAEDAPAIVLRLLKHAAFAVTEIVVERPNGQLSNSIPCDDAYMIGLNLGADRNKTYWEEGREIVRCVHGAGETSLCDLRRDPRSVMHTPIHNLMMYLPRATMNVLAEQANLPRVENLRFDPGVGIRDGIYWELGRSLLPALRAPEEANRLFTDHIAMALASYTAYAYGGQNLTRPIRGGLASWQEKRAKEMILHDLSGSISMDDIATACGLSASHFARSFRKTTGFAPHTWLLRARVQQAMVLLQQRGTVIGDVAAACGFANTRHFARVFARQTGVSPRVWRREFVR